MSPRPPGRRSIQSTVNNVPSIRSNGIAAKEMFVKADLRVVLLSVKTFIYLYSIPSMIVLCMPEI